jgi:hypothetical protein
MLNQKIRDHVAASNISDGIPDTDHEIIETIREGDHVWTGDRSDRRWWTDCFTVVNVDGMLIGFADAETTGDDSPRDRGWEFDQSTICEVEAFERTVTEYRPVG